MACPSNRLLQQQTIGRNCESQQGHFFNFSRSESADEDVDDLAIADAANDDDDDGSGGGAADTNDQDFNQNIRTKFIFDAKTKRSILELP